jgi:hypothetical protein
MLGNLPFYNFLNQNNSRTFNHAIGLPKKNGQEYPLFDYEQLVYNTLQNHKHVWIKKATGLGITEFMLRYMAWLCLRDKTLDTYDRYLRWKWYYDSTRYRKDFQPD